MVSWAHASLPAVSPNSISISSAAFAEITIVMNTQTTERQYTRRNSRYLHREAEKKEPLFFYE